MANYLLAIDQGTTSSRAIVFSSNGQSVSQHQLEFEQFFPHTAWVEHDPEEIWQTTLTCCKSALLKAKLNFSQIAGIGITNQRETTVVWQRQTGQPIYKAIVWQDRRTTDFCQALKVAGHEAMVQEKTGLLLDPYFSASKLAWILDHVPGARQAAEKGELAFGTMDCFLLWRLTGGKVHATDASNAARTLLFNIQTQAWDRDLLKLFNIPENMLPKVLDNVADFGKTDQSLFGVEVPIAAMAGDQQAALVGQACFQRGMIKSTYGTGCFLMLNTAERMIHSKTRLLTTVAYRLNGRVTYALEGSIFSAGATVQWLRDKLKIIQHASDTEAMAAGLENNGGVYLVPAFVGLGAPYWDPDARGAIVGLTRNSSAAHIARAALEAVAYQTNDLISSMLGDGARALAEIRVDGGMVVNNWAMQYLADILQLPVARSAIAETTALGVAYLAGLGVGVYQSLDEIAKLWQIEKRFEPKMAPDRQRRRLKAWRQAMARVTLNTESLNI